MNLDEQLQQSLEAGQTPTDAEGRLYRQVFDALAQEPRPYLPADFAAATAHRILMAQKSRAADRHWFGAGLVALLVAGIVAIALTKPSLSWGVFSFLKAYPGLLVIGLLLMAAFQWLERRLLRPRQGRLTA